MNGVVENHTSSIERAFFLPLNPSRADEAQFIQDKSLAY